MQRKLKIIKKLKQNIRDELFLLRWFLWINLIFFGQQWSGGLFGYSGVLSSLVVASILYLLYLLQLYNDIPNAWLPFYSTMLLWKSYYSKCYLSSLEVYFS